MIKTQLPYISIGAKSSDPSNCIRTWQIDSLCRTAHLWRSRNEYPPDRSCRFDIPPSQLRMVAAMIDMDRRLSRWVRREDRWICAKADAGRRTAVAWAGNRCKSQGTVGSRCCSSSGCPEWVLRSSGHTAAKYYYLTMFIINNRI